MAGISPDWRLHIEKMHTRYQLLLLGILLTLILILHSLLFRPAAELDRRPESSLLTFIHKLADSRRAETLGRRTDGQGLMDVELRFHNQEIERVRLD